VTVRSRIAGRTSSGTAASAQRDPRYRAAVIPTTILAEL